MSRAAGGAYTLPAGNPVVTGTLISSTWGNTTLSDVATTLTDSLSRSGLGGMTAPLLGADGAVGTPAYSFTNEPSSGIYRIGASNLGVSIAGTKRIDLGAAALSTVGLNVSLGAPAAGTPLTVNGTAATNTQFQNNTGTTTGYGYSQWSNTTGLLQIGVENSVGGALVAGSTPYSSNIITASATALNLVTNNVIRQNIGSTGNVTINAPSGGPTLTVTNTSSGANAIFNSSNAAGGYNVFQATNADVGYWGSGSRIFADASTDFAITAIGVNQLLLGTNSAKRLTISGTGAVAVLAPAAATAALTVNGAASTPGFSIGNSSTAFTLDCSKSNVQYVTMTGNVAAGSLTISNIQDGQSINLLLTQDATGTRTLGNPTGVKWPGGTVGVLSTAASSVDMITFTRINAVTYATILKAFA